MTVQRNLSQFCMSGQTHPFMAPIAYGLRTLRLPRLKKWRIKWGEQGLKQMELKKEKGRSQGALKLFCPKTNFPF